MSEKKVASYQESGVRLQLVRIDKEDIGSDGIPTSLSVTHYQIRKNRKVLMNTDLPNSAAYWFRYYIGLELSQTKLYL